MDLKLTSLVALMRPELFIYTPMAIAWRGVLAIVSGSTYHVAYAHRRDGHITQARVLAN